MTRPPFPTRRLLAGLAALALTTTSVVAVAAPASAAKPAPPAPVLTRAALDPALLEGRGANVPFLEQEAENGVTSGTPVGADRAAYALAAEASGRRAVSLAPGQYVE